MKLKTQIRPLNPLNSYIVQKEKLLSTVASFECRLSTLTLRISRCKSDCKPVAARAISIRAADSPSIES